MPYGRRRPKLHFGEEKGKKTGGVSPDCPRVCRLAGNGARATFCASATTAPTTASIVANDF